MKKCPFCAEEIQDEAVKCKHCGEFLVKKEVASTKFEKVVMTKKVAKVGVKKQLGFHYFIDRQGDISSISVEMHNPKKVAKVGIGAEKGFFYFIDEQGDIACVRESSIPNASEEIKKNYEVAEKVGRFTYNEAEHSSSSSGKSIAIIIIVCIPLVIWYGSWYSKNVRLTSNNSQTVNKPDVPDNIIVCIGAEELVKGRLVSPGSAKFPDCNDQQIVSVGTNKWQVSSYVDSQNSYGGLLRSNYSIVVKYLGNQSFSLDEVKEFTDGGQQ